MQMFSILFGGYLEIYVDEFSEEFVGYLIPFPFTPLIMLGRVFSILMLSASLIIRRGLEIRNSLFFLRMMLFSLVKHRVH
uniref:Uncharacterized protein n=1 Tax=Parascaris equorum TaxID=6256 RepID=A0A914RQ63_PAREQ